MEWITIEVPASSMKDGGYHRLCRSFQRAFIDAGAPVDLALFALRRADPVRRLFLTPSSMRYVPDLIRAHDGCRCAAPAASAVTLVYGVPRARALLDSGERLDGSDAAEADTTPYGLEPTPQPAP